MDNLSLAASIRRVADGDMAALEDIFLTTKDSIYASALVLLGSKQGAEDAVQETMVEVARCAGQFRGDNAKAWVLRIAHNEAVSFLRKRGRETPLDESLEDVLGDSGMAAADGQLGAAELLDSLPQNCREIVVLHVVAGLRHREIAKLLHLPLGTVCWRYSESMKILKQISQSKAKEVFE